MRPLQSILVTVILATALVAGQAYSQAMDYNLSQAIRSIDSITSGLERLQANDINGFKRLSKKLDKAVKLLETSESRSHPDYTTTAQQLTALQQQLAQFGAAQAASDSGGSSAGKQPSQPAAVIEKPDAPAATQSAQPSSNQSAAMDYNLSQAIRHIDSITTGLPGLRKNDINGFNRLSTKLNKAAELLQNSTSKSHPNFQPTAQRWTVLQRQMAEIATALQAAQAEQQKLLADQQAKQLAEAEEKKQAKAAEKARVAELARLHSHNASTVLNPMSAKYSRDSLPKLAAAPTPEQARVWATAMHQLRTSQKNTDIAEIDALLANHSVSEEDARNTKFWITEGSQHAIEENIRNARSAADGAVVSMRYSAELINAVELNDMNAAYRFAGAEKYENNLQRLDNAIRAGAVIDIYDSVFGNTVEDRNELLTQIVAARKKLDLLKPIADEQARVLASAEPATPPAKKDFLAPIAQEYWLDGNLFAESDTDGAIWIDGNEVGVITHNGEIWIGSNDMGSIEPNGEVWFDANLVGSLEPNGEVWRDGNQVGLIEQNGTVWVNSNPAGEIQPFHGEWKRAAIVYYYRDFFAQ